MTDTIVQNTMTPQERYNHLTGLWLIASPEERGEYRRQMDMLQSLFTNPSVVTSAIVNPTPTVREVMQLTGQVQALFTEKPTRDETEVIFFNCGTSLKWTYRTFKDDGFEKGKKKIKVVGTGTAQGEYLGLVKFSDYGIKNYGIAVKITKPTLDLVKDSIYSFKLESMADLQILG